MFISSSRFSLILFAWVLLISNVAFSQGNIKKMDSLITVAKSIVNADSGYKMVEDLLKETKRHEYQLGTVNLLLLKVNLLYNSGRFDEGLKLTYQIEKEFRDLNDNTKIANLLIYRANCYANLLFFDKCNHFLNEAIDYANRIKDNDLRYTTLGRIDRIKANNFKLNSRSSFKMDSMMYYTKRSYNTQLKIKKNNSKMGLVIEASSIGQLFYKQDHLDSAKYYFNESRKYVKLTNGDKFGIESLLGLGQIYEKQNLNDSALYYYKDALRVAQIGNRVGNIKNSYQLLFGLYAKIGDKIKSQEYAQKYSAITDSIAQANKAAISGAAGLVIKDYETQDNHRKRQYYIIIASSLVFLVLLLGFVFVLRNRHNKSLANYQQEQQSLIRLKKFKADQVDQQRIDELISLAKSNHPAFFDKFKESYPSFIQKMMQISSSMLAADLILGAQLKLGFNTKEIAWFTKSSIRAVEARKYRVRKKIGLKASEDLPTWIVNL